MTQAELYVVATPLGNRQDITLRAIECLKQVPWVFAEDTREALKLMELCGVSAQGKKLHSYASHNLKKATALACQILAEGQNIALVTDRGTPAVSDPGALLVAAARAQGARVVPVPGASALTALVSVSGWVRSDFYFAGFFPRENKARAEFCERVRRMGTAACFYESPRRVRETVTHLAQAFPQGSIFFGRELTKLHEQTQWVSLSEADCSLEFPELGEYVLLLDPGPTLPVQDWKEEVNERTLSDRQWSKQVASRHGVTASEVYNALQKAKPERS